MNKEQFEKSLLKQFNSVIAKWEGGIVNDLEDPGGFTRGGIALKARQRLCVVYLVLCQLGVSEGAAPTLRRNKLLAISGCKVSTLRPKEQQQSFVS